MQRWLVVLGIAAVAAFAIWHPAAHGGSGFTQIPTATAPGGRRVRVPARSPRTGAVVYVVGAVVRPGLYTLVEPARVEAAIRAAGGMSADADPAGVNLAAFAADGDEIDVPLIGQAPRARVTRARRTTRSRTVAVDSPPEAVDPNAADAATLASVPGVGPALAARIVAYRQVNGPFGSLDELLDVAGMTPAKLDRAQPYLQLGAGL